MQEMSWVRRTFKDPDDGDGDDYDDVLPLEEECIPYPELCLERERVREEGDVPLGRERR